MMILPTASRCLPVLLLSVVLAIDGVAQDVKPSSSTQTSPVASANTGERWVRARDSRTPPLRRTVSVRLNGAPLRTALDAIARSAGLTMAYGEDVLRSKVHVTLRADGMSLLDALATVLDGTGLDAFVSLRGDALLVRASTSLPRGPTGTVVGSITDAKTGERISAAEIFLEHTRWRTTTDSAGRYRLAEVDTGAYELTVRRLGYAKQSRPVMVAAERMDTIDIALEPIATRLNELVTTATGRQRRLDIANDVTTINADSVMQAAPIGSVTDLLEGRVPGLTVQRTSGAPGDPARLRLRGASSPLRSNDPIVVVDGIRVYAEQSAARSANLANTGNSNYATPSPLDYIDPNSIETIEVLKGPSAATLYGQDAANGVIVITTKKGKAGPTRWTASVEHGRTQMEGSYPGLLVRWGRVAYNNRPVYCPITGQTIGLNGGLSCEGDSTTSFQILNDPELTVLDKGHRTGLTWGASGGSTALTYAMTGSYQEELGLVKLPEYEANSYTARIGTTVPDWMRRPQHLTQWGATGRVTARLGNKADLSFTTTLSRTAQQRSDLENRLANLETTYLDKSSGIYYGRDGVALFTAVNGGISSYFTRVTAEATQFSNGMNLDWRPRSWLELTSDAGLNVIQRADQQYMPRGLVSSPDSIGSLVHGEGNSLVSTVNVRALANVPIPYGFQFRFAAGVNYAGQSIRDQAVKTSDLAAGTSLQGSILDGASRRVEDDATFGWYAEPSVGNSKLNFTGGLRFDGGSSYGSSVTLPTFPKLGFSYLLSDEPFFPFRDIVPVFRLRVAYGRASRQPGVTDRLRLYATPQSVWTEGQSDPGVFLETLGNTELRPERTTEFEGGFDADLLDSRLTVSLTAYRKTTDDALLNTPLAPSVYGDVSVLRNIGKVRNTGLEVTVGAQLVRNGPVSWGTQLSVSQNRNVVVELGSGVEPFYVSTTGDAVGFGNLEGGVRVAAGYPLFGNWALPVLGYADANGNGLLDPGEYLLGDTAVYVGQTLPNYIASLHTTVSLWHGAVTLNVDLQYEDGLTQWNTTTDRLAIFSAGANDPGASLAEQLMAVTFNSNSLISNSFQTVSTFRFNSMAMTYAVPETIARRLGAQTLRLSLQGSNLGLWTNYRGLDPNVNSNSTGNGVVDRGVIPQPRMWQVRMSATY